MPKILLVEKIFEEGIKLLAEHGEVHVSPSTDENILIKQVRDADGIIVRTSSLSSRVIEAGQRLKVIGRHGIGFENIDIEAATQKGVVVVYTPMAHIRSVAEHIIGTMLYLCKKLQAVDQALREGRFNLTGSLVSQVGKLGFLTTEMAGKTVGMIGYGRIAGELARICRNGFDMNILAYDPYVQEDKIIRDQATPCASMEEVFSRSDFVSMHVPLTPKTEGLIGWSQLSLMKETAFFINTSRGGIVKEEDLYRTLKSHRIAGAAVDVFEEEPPPRKPSLF